MPEETKIDIGDNDEEAVEVNLSEEESPSNVEVSSEEELEDYSSGVKSRINNLTKRSLKAGLPIRLLQPKTL